MLEQHRDLLYPKWWKGIKYKKPIQAWAASNSSQSTRDILQVAYLGGVSRQDFGTGSIPKQCIDRTVMSRGIGDAVETVHVKHKSGGISELGFKSYDQGREKFQGTSRHFIHLDEEPPIKVYEECLLRTLTTKGSILTSMTPLSGITKMVRRFWNADLPAGTVVDSKALVTASWDDTDHLSKEDKDEFRRSLPAHVLEAREKGIPAIGEGMVYPIEESAISCQRFPIPDHYKRFFAMDFGWNPDPTVALFFAYDGERDILYIHDEYSQNEATPKSHAALIMGKGGDWLSGVADPYGGVTSSISDGENMIDKYNAVGLKIIPCIRAAKLNGIIDVLEMMKEGRLKIFSDLGGLWDEFRMYAYDSKGKPKDKDDHFMDTMRYGVQSGMSVAKSKKDLKKNSWLNRWSGGISNKIDWRTI